MWMNEHEIDEASRVYADHPVLGPAVRTLDNLMRWTNANSDGWPYWQKPSRAADSLMDLVRGEGAHVMWRDNEREDVTEADVRKAVRPIKAFRTRMVNSGKPTFEIVETLPEPPPPPVGEVTVTVSRSAGADGAVVVMVDTTFEPDASDGSPGLRVLVNDGTVYEGKVYGPVAGDIAPDAKPARVMRVEIPG